MPFHSVTIFLRKSAFAGETEKGCVDGNRLSIEANELSHEHFVDSGVNNNPSCEDRYQFSEDWFRGPIWPEEIKKHTNKSNREDMFSPRLPGLEENLHLTGCFSDC